MLPRSAVRSARCRSAAGRGRNHSGQRKDAGRSRGVTCGTASGSCVSGNARSSRRSPPTRSESLPASVSGSLIDGNHAHTVPGAKQRSSRNTATNSARVSRSSAPGRSSPSCTSTVLASAAVVVPIHAAICSRAAAPSTGSSSSRRAEKSSSAWNASRQYSRSRV